MRPLLARRRASRSRVSRVQRGWPGLARRATWLLAVCAAALAIALAASGPAAAKPKKRPPPRTTSCAKLAVGPLANYLRVGSLSRASQAHLPAGYCNYAGPVVSGHYPSALLLAVLPGSSANFALAVNYSEASAGLAGVALEHTSVIHAGQAVFTTFMHESKELCMLQTETAEQTGQPMQGPACSTLQGDIVVAWDTRGKGPLRGSIVAVGVQADISQHLTLSAVLGLTEQLMQGRIL